MAAVAPGFIEPHVLYRQDEICKRLGWAKPAWDAARRRGLDKKLLRSGKRNYVRGSAMIEWLEADAKAPPADQPPQPQPAGEIGNG